MASGVVILLCGWVLASCRGSNLDVEEPIVFREDAASFGQTVVQFGGSRLVVGAPLEAVAVNQTGRLYDCAPATGMCQPIVLSSPLEAVNMSLGLSLVTATNNAQLLACGPTAQRACVKNMYAKGSCLLLGSSLQFIQAVPPSMPECPRQEMDIAFLIDGSGSIDPKDFAQMKDFVKALMGEFASTSTLVNPEHCGLWKGDTCRKKAQHSWWGRKSRGRDHAGRSPGQCASSGLI